uniref:Uncharacterized protein n=1 Tax=Arundo donax TaxID=35708 RepID=A0A0A9F0G9_ARUDO
MVVVDPNDKSCWQTVQKHIGRFCLQCMSVVWIISGKSRTKMYASRNHLSSPYYFSIFFFLSLLISFALPSDAGCTRADG